MASYCSYYGQTYHSESRQTCLSGCLGQMIFVTQGSYSVRVCVYVCEFKPGVCVYLLRMCLCDAVVSYYCASVSLQRHQRLASAIETTLNKQTGRQTQSHSWWRLGTKPKARKRPFNSRVFKAEIMKTLRYNDNFTTTFLWVWIYCYWLLIIKETDKHFLELI